jgi:small conductance mechanosensitive channel
MQGLIESFQAAAVGWGPMLVAAILVLVIGWWVARLLISLTRRAMKRADVDDTLTGFLCNILYVGLMALVVISALGQLGVNTTSFAAIIAAAGLAVGFALQGSLGNFASGVMLIAFRPFKSGDFVEAGGVSGIVEEIQVFATRIRTHDNREITVPNGQITGGSIVNYSAKDTRRIDLTFGIGYDDDIAKAKNVVERIKIEFDRENISPAPAIVVVELADSSVNIAVRPWVKSGDYGAVRSDLLERVKVEFDRANISIPYPQSDVHLRQVAAA